MKKIAIFKCRKSTQVCAGAACLQAYNGRLKAFARYAGEETELVAFSDCNGCGQTLSEDAGLREKVDRIISIGTQTVHFGLCTADKTGLECAVIGEIGDCLGRHGITVIRGTH